MRNLAKLAAVASTLAVMATDNAMAIPVTLQNATATFSQPGFQVANAIDASLGSGWAIDPVVVNQTAVFETAVFETVTDLFSAGAHSTLHSIKDTVIVTLLVDFGSLPPPILVATLQMAS